jgi:DNA polymerase-3 subunit gamma/tau
LEEPPEWVVFILCTTEVHKIPTTIASRCQQFSFRSVDFRELVQRMRWICEQEGIQADDEVLTVIAQAGEGSVRDSLSALDQAIACCGQTLQAPELRSLLGLFSTESLSLVATALENNDAGQMLTIVQELEENGRSLQHFCRELSRFFRNLLVAKISGKPSSLIAASEAEQQKLLDTAQKFSEEDLTRYLQLTLETFQDLQTSLQPRLHLEIGLVRLVHAGRLVSIEKAMSELGSVPATAPQATTTAPPLRESTAPPQRPAPSGPSPFQRDSARKVPPPLPPRTPPAATAPTPAAAPVPEREPSPQPKPPVAEPVRETPVTPPSEQSGDLRQALHAALVELGMAFTADAVEHSEVRQADGEVELIVPKEFALAVSDADIKKGLEKALGRPMRVKVTIGTPTAAAAPIAKTPPPTDKEVTERALGHPDVQRFQELFPDAQVRAVRNLKE